MVPGEGYLRIGQLSKQGLDMLDANASEQYYPRKVIPLKTQFLLEELLGG